MPERASAPPTLSASLPAPAAGAPCHRRGDSEHPRLRALAAASLRAACHRGWVQFSGAFYKGTDPTGGGGWEAPLLRPNRLRRPRPLPPSRGGSGSPQSGRGHVHAARKSGVRNASVRTRRRGQTLLRARPGQADAENSSDSACTSENVGLRRLTPQMKDGGSEPRRRKSQKKTEADY